MARLPYPDPATLSERTQVALRRLPPLGIFRTLAWADDSGRRFLRAVFSLWDDAELSPRHRELAILRVARLGECEYEWRQHVPLALAAGVSQAEVDALEADAGAAEFAPDDAALLAVTDAIVGGPTCEEEDFERLRSSFTPREIVELYLVAGSYLTLARLMTHLELEVEEVAAPRGD